MASWWLILGTETRIDHEICHFAINEYEKEAMPFILYFTRWYILLKCVILYIRQSKRDFP